MTAEAAAKASVSKLGAVIYRRADDVDAVISGFVGALRTGGVRVGGILQSMRSGGGAGREAFVSDIGSGARLPIFQDLGHHAVSCRADADALARAGQMILRALEEKPDLIVINRFGKLESAGGGMSQEIGAAVLSGIPVLIAVAERHAAAWDRFADGHDARLACTRAALEDWWKSVTVGRSSFPSFTGEGRARSFHPFINHRKT